MKKMYNTSLFFLMSVLAFAQGPSEEGRFDSSPEENFGPGGGSATPIDNYTILLITLAVVMIAYVVYRRMQAQKVA